MFNSINLLFIILLKSLNLTSELLHSQTNQNAETSLIVIYECRWGMESPFSSVLIEMLNTYGNFSPNSSRACFSLHKAYSISPTR